jgi:LysM repeat protein
VLVAEPVADVTPAASYTVKSGDSLWTIARRHGLTVAQLTAANSLSANAPLQPGQKLIIPSRPATPPSSGSTPAAKPANPAAAAAAGRAPGESVKHIVKSGETLGAIARRYDVRQGDLAVLNNIADPAKIRPGMELVIPGYKAPVPKSGRSTKSSSGSTTKSAAPAATPAPAPAPAPVLEPAPQIPVVVEPAPAPPPPTVPVIKIN